MTTRAPGPTPAMRRALEMFPATTADWFHRLLGQGLIEAKSPFDALRQMDHQLSPRGHAALAAEPMTQGMLAVLVEVEAGASIYAKHSNSANACERKGWISAIDILGDPERELTPTDRTQLHNIRAAMPGAWP